MAKTKKAERPFIERFWEKVNKETQNGCWEWIAGTRQGYGAIKELSGFITDAHRVSFKMHFGEIPKGMVICHKCDNRKCVNPSHLFLGTHADNVADKVAKGRQPKGMKPKLPFKPGQANISSKLTETQVKEILTRYKDGERQANLMRYFGVSRQTICNIVNGKRWKYLNEGI